MDKWWRQHAKRKDFAVCMDCTGKMPIEIAEESEVCPFCKNRASRNPFNDQLQRAMKDANIEIDGSIERIRGKK